ncbi:Hsp70 family protein [Scytonema sp. NUACC26]|uniref:Hsp70 family protein n=1 Tax=Scytonema sp. NUACC26 TaxID=3140176 RepID=UPI0034DCC099
MFRVKATSGDTHLGGDDFDSCIVGWMKETFQPQHGVDLPVAEDNSLRSQLRKTAETLAKLIVREYGRYYEGESRGSVAQITQSATNLALSFKPTPFK